MADINPLVVDLSHWDPAEDYDAVKEDGIVGVIYKATEGGSYTDPTYVNQQHSAKQAGLLWGAYHFADASNVNAQIDNFMSYACPDPDELFCLDWEDNGGDTMSLANVKTWMKEVEKALGREGQCVLYGGNTIKENGNGDPFITERRLWLCQYNTSYSLPVGYEKLWLWQFTGDGLGPAPHSVDGIPEDGIDINSYEGEARQLIAEWATGKRQPEPSPEPEPELNAVNIIIASPPGVIVKVRQATLGQYKDRKRGRRL